MAIEPLSMIPTPLLFHADCFFNVAQSLPNSIYQGFECFFGSVQQTFFFQELGVQILLNHKDYDHKSVSLWPMLDANMRTLYLCATHTNYHTMINNLDAGFLVVRFSDSLALGRASGMGNLTRFLDASLQTPIKRFN